MKENHRIYGRTYCGCEKKALRLVRGSNSAIPVQRGSVPGELASQLEAGHRVV